MLKLIKMKENLPPRLSITRSNYVVAWGTAVGTPDLRITHGDSQLHSSLIRPRRIDCRKWI